MSCNRDPAHARVQPSRHLGVLAQEGFRLFFPLSALYMSLFPIMWVVAWRFDLPLAREVPPSLWHGYEMLIGAFGAALLGFLTTAVPEWTDTEPPRGRPLVLLALCWTAGRCIGFMGWDAINGTGAIADLAWISALLVWILKLSLKQRTGKLMGFSFWLSLLLLWAAVARWGFYVKDLDLASFGIQQAGLAYLGLLGLALARITVPVTNLILDPTERTSPFRPHPGRINLAPGLVLIAMVGNLADLSPQVSGFLLIAAGAGFMDRAGEGFIGRAAFRAEIMLLMGSSLFAGCGLMLAGAARIGAAWPEVVGWHVVLMGGLGLGVYAVFCIAGLLHTNQPLGLSPKVRAGAVLVGLSVCLRAAPELGVYIPGPLHWAAALFWGGGYLLWLQAYWPALRRIPVESEPNKC